MQRIRLFSMDRGVLKTAILRCATALLATLGCLILIELALRLSGRELVFLNPLNSFHTGDSELGWVGVPNFTGRFHRREFDVRIVNGPRGFRMGAAQIVPEPGAERVVFLGDSFTWGWGVEQGEVFTDSLQDLVGPRFELLNRGVNASGTVQQSILLERLLEQDQPDRVVVMLFYNDYLDNLDAKRGRRPYIQISDDSAEYSGRPVTRPLGGFWRSFRRRSAVLTLLAEGQNRIRRVIETQLNPEIPEPDRLFHPEPAHVRALEVSLDRMRSLCEGRCTLTVVFVPEKNEVAEIAPAAATAAMISDKLGIGFTDLTPAFRRASRGTTVPLYFAHDGHWTHAGHQVAATELARQLFGDGDAEPDVR